MKSKLLFLLVLFVSFASCQKEGVDYLRIKGITERTMDGSLTYLYFDPDDWNLNDQFTKREKRLFEGLDFSKTTEAEPPYFEEMEGMVSEFTSPRIYFYPNPFSEITYIGYYHSDHIINLVVVDNHYNKLLSYRGEVGRISAISWVWLDSGIYRMYYVIQDKNDNIIHCGHGDILKSIDDF